MEIKNSHQPVEETITEQRTEVQVPGRVVLYNDDWHTFDEVITQLVKATRCSAVKARDFAFEVHFKGKAIVFSGDIVQCLRVSSILEEIALHTQVIT